MKYCSGCGSELKENSKFCSSCGKQFSFSNDPIQTKENSISVIVCAIVGLLFPLIGAVLYYVLKKSDLKAAKTANICSWISILVRFLYFLFYGITIFSFF